LSQYAHVAILVAS